MNEKDDKSGVVVLIFFVLLAHIIRVSFINDRVSSLEAETAALQIKVRAMNAAINRGALK